MVNRLYLRLQRVVQRSNSVVLRGGRCNTYFEMLWSLLRKLVVWRQYVKIESGPYHDEYEGCGDIRISSLRLSNLRQLSPSLGLRANFNKIGCFQCDIILGLGRGVLWDEPLNSKAFRPVFLAQYRAFQSLYTHGVPRAVFDAE